MKPVVQAVISSLCSAIAKAAVLINSAQQACGALF